MHIMYLFNICTLVLFCLVVGTIVARALEDTAQQKDDAAAAATPPNTNELPEEKEVTIDATERDLTSVWTFDSGKYVVVKSKQTWDDGEF
jgi:hypothetical protein